MAVGIENVTLWDTMRPPDVTSLTWHGDFIW